MALFVIAGTFLNLFQSRIVSRRHGPIAVHIHDIVGTVLCE